LDGALRPRRLILLSVSMEFPSGFDDFGEALCPIG
jgi:hypothetical protein